MQHNPQPYFPNEVFTGKGERLPRVFVSPQRYIQGAGVINHVGRYLSLLNTKRAGVLMSKRGQGTDGVRILDSLRSSNIDPVVSTFGGECSLEEIEHHVSNLAKEGLDCLIAVGGGKCVDAGKSIAYRLGVSVVILPTLASNDAPCSALSVLYDTAGVSVGAEFFPDNPALVIVDTEVVAAASERYLVSGMGDAMATWYEARVCLNNPQATSMVGARPTLASCAMGEICAQTLFEQGESAASAVAKGMVDDNLENIVEANTLLSGIGFESGGLALAHAIAQSLTAVPVAHDNYLHGEHVAIGTMVQLMMEQHVDTERVAKFFARVGLPVHLGQISLSREDQTAIRTIVEATVSWPTSHNMPIPVNDQSIRSALVSADELGLSVAASVGDDAYRRLQK